MSPWWPYAIGNFIIPILPTKKLRIRETEQFRQGDRVRSYFTTISDSECQQFSYYTSDFIFITYDYQKLRYGFIKGIILVSFAKQHIDICLLFPPVSDELHG